METLAAQLCFSARDRIIERFALNEILCDGGAYMPLTAPAFGNAPVGELRLWDGGSNAALSKMVYIGMTVEQIGMDSHMMFMFSQPDSLVPAFTVDSVHMKMPPGMDPRHPDGAETFAFHLDLIPQVDLAINLPYMEKVFMPLSDQQERCLAYEGITPAQLSSSQRAIMSPWMLAQRADQAAFEGVVFESVANYLEHWLGLAEDGLADVPYHGADVATRESQNRALIFSRELDPVWAQIDRMVGAEVSDQMISILRAQELPAA